MSTPKFQFPTPKPRGSKKSDESRTDEAACGAFHPAPSSDSAWELEVGRWKLTRRSLLKNALIVGFALHPDVMGAQGPPPSGSTLDPPRTPLDVKEVDSFLAIHPDGRITIYTSKVDVGTGMRVAIAQMAAEELGVPIGRITLVDGDTARCPNTGGTGGSTGLTRGGTAVRQAAATARQALLRLGSERLKVPVAELTIANGEVRRPASSRGLGIGRLVGGRQLN